MPSKTILTLSFLLGQRHINTHIHLIKSTLNVCEYIVTFNTLQSFAPFLHHMGKYCLMKLYLILARSLMWIY